MSGRVSRMSVTVASLGLVLAMAQLAAAQRGGGTFGGVSPAQLASLEQVQSALKLNDDQKAKAAAISQQLASDRRGLFEGASRENFEALRERLEKLNSEAAAKIEQALDDVQRKRLKEISIQVNGAAALSDAEVAQALKITDQQQAKLAEVRAANAQALRDAFQSLGDASSEARREKLAQLRQEGDEKLLAALTADQRAQFEKMKGQPIELDLSQLFRRRSD